MPPPPPPLPQKKKTALLGTLRLSGDKTKLLLNSNVVADLKVKEVKKWKVSQQSIADEKEFVNILKMLLKKYGPKNTKNTNSKTNLTNVEAYIQRELDASSSRTNANNAQTKVETYFKNEIIKKALSTQTDKQNLLMTLRTSVGKDKRVRDSQLVHRLIFQKTRESRAHSTHQYYDFRSATNQTGVVNGQTHITVNLSKEGEGLNRAIMDLAPLFAYMMHVADRSANIRTIMTSVRDDLSHVLLKPITIDITMGPGSVKDLDDMVEKFMESRKKAVLSLVKKVLNHHNEIISIIAPRSTSKTTLDGFLKEAVQKTPTTFNLKNVDLRKLRHALAGLSYTTLKPVILKGQLPVNKPVLKKLGTIQASVQGLLDELTGERDRLDQVLKAVGEFQKKLEEIKNTLLRPSVRSHPNYHIKNMGYHTMHTILESLKGEISHLVKALAVAGEPEKAVPHAITQTVAETAAESLAPNHPELQDLQSQISTAEKKASALAREKEALEARVTTILSQKNALTLNKAKTNASIAKVTASLSSADTRMKEQEEEIRRLKKRLRVYTGVVISGAAATVGAYATGFYRGKARPMPRTKNNTKAFMNAAQAFNTNAFVKQSLRPPASGGSGNGRRATRPGNAGRQPKAPNASGLYGVSPYGGVPSAPLLLPKGTNTPPQQVLMLPRGSGNSKSIPKKGYSSMAVPAAAGLLGGAYLAKRLATRGKKKTSGRGNRSTSSATRRGNIYTNNTANTASSIRWSTRQALSLRNEPRDWRRQGPSEVLRHSREALRLTREAKKAMEGVSFPSPRRR
jgi:hypothetical protein